MNPDTVIKYPVSNEKSIRMMEAENKLLFVVDRHSTKVDIKRSVEKIFNVKVVSVNTAITPRGTKRAYVTLSQETPAIDIMTQLGLM